MQLACLNSCYIGAVSWDSTKDRCWTCDLTQTLDIDGICKTTCSTNFYIKNDAVSYK